jgi:hypothetical protein
MKQEPARIGTTISAITLFAALMACKVSSGDSDVKAKVDCTGSDTTIDCDVIHVAGSSAANVCWDLHYVCANNQVVTGQNFCQSVGPGATAQRRIPLSELTNFQNCDKVASSEVKNLKISSP